LNQSYNYILFPLVAVLYLCIWLFQRIKWWWWWRWWWWWTPCRSIYYSLERY